MRFFAWASVKLLAPATGAALVRVPLSMVAAGGVLSARGGIVVVPVRLSGAVTAGAVVVRFGWLGATCA